MLPEEENIPKESSYVEAYEELNRKRGDSEIEEALFKLFKKEKLNIHQTCSTPLLKKKISQKRVIEYFKQKIFK